MIYLDNAATTKPSENAINFANKFIKDCYFNPSALYQGGIDCQNEIKKAKEFILKTLGATNHNVIFNSCGSEGDNQAIFCLIKRGTFVTDKGEHSAVYKSFLELKNKGQNVIFCDLNKNGSVNTEKLYQIIKENKVDFLSIMHVNNETGAINDVNEIGKKIKSINPKIIFHVDGVQSYGKIPFKLSKEIDLFTISAHKINALKGTGALIIRKGLTFSPIIFGGGQENGLRSGTENVFGIKTFEYASMEHYEKLHENFDKVTAFYNYFSENLEKNNTILISSGNTSPYIFTFSVKGIRGEIMMHDLEEKGVIVGNGSACSSKNRFSRVIEACGYKEDVLDGVVRISFSPYQSVEEIKKAVSIINESIIELKGKMGK